MATRSRSPWFGCITLTAQNTAYNLVTLLAAATNPPLLDSVSKIALALYFFVHTATAKVYFGNDDVNLAVNSGFMLVGGQVGPQPLSHGGLGAINLNDIYLESDTNATVVGVVLVPR